MGVVRDLLAKCRGGGPQQAPSPAPISIPAKPAPEPGQRAYTIGDLARISGSKPPFARGVREDGYLTIAPGTIYLGNVEWWRFTDNPRLLRCAICDCDVTNYYMAISHHVHNFHAPNQI